MILSLNKNEKSGFIVKNEIIDEILNDWVRKLNEDEFYFTHAFETLIESFTSYEAFDFIELMVQTILKLDNPFLVNQFIFFTGCLYSKAKTTELHPVMEKNLPAIEKHILQLQNSGVHREWQELKRDLRLP